ncbi:MAG: hypothetical protein M9962_07660 [Oligoflexia bacterium]|nr:hypothetical protein [Oligoflexia bacterium]
MKFFIYLLLPLLNTYSTQAANMAWQQQSVACFKTEQDSVDVSNTQKSTTIICEVFIQNKTTLYKVTFRDIYAGPHKELIFISKENSFYGHSLIKREAKFNTQLNLGLLTEQKILSNEDISYFKKTFLIKHKTSFMENVITQAMTIQKI